MSVAHTTLFCYHCLERPSKQQLVACIYSSFRFKESIIVLILPYKTLDKCFGREKYHWFSPDINFEPKPLQKKVHLSYQCRILQQLKSTTQKINLYYQNRGPSSRSNATTFHTSKKNVLPRRMPAYATVRYGA
jgi:hypothetical protein